MVCDAGPRMAKSLDRLSADYGKLMMEKSSCDLVFEVYTEYGDVVEMHAHSLILRARSEYFQVVLNSSMSETIDGRIQITDVPPTVFQHFLQYVYTGSVPLTQETALHLYVIGDKYLLEDLKQICLDFIWNSLDSATITPLLVCAVTIGVEPKFVNLLLSYAAGHIGEITQEDFNSLTPELVLAILQCTSLSARESDLLSLVCSWAKQLVDKQIQTQSAQLIQCFWRRWHRLRSNKTFCPDIFRPLSTTASSRPPPNPLPEVQRPPSPEGDLCREVDGCVLSEEAFAAAPALAAAVACLAGSAATVAELLRGDADDPLASSLPQTEVAVTPAVPVPVNTGPLPLEDGFATTRISSNFASSLSSSLAACILCSAQGGSCPMHPPRPPSPRAADSPPPSQSGKGEVSGEEAVSRERRTRMQQRAKQRKLELLRSLLDQPLKHIRFPLVNQKDLTKLAERSKIKIVTDACKAGTDSCERRTTSSIVTLDIPLHRERTEKNFEYNGFKFKVAIVKLESSLGIYLHFQYHTYPHLFVINARGIKINLVHIADSRRKKTRTLDDRIGLGRFGLGYKTFITAAEFPEFISESNEIRVEIDFPFYNQRKLQLFAGPDREETPGK
eukprot:TRINITY_DN2461_c0_g2_i1.p1 TRINITY_DN2461_c0_g2~~TRINITY_DN2461_c0_g2_i1.p1  ORF type:complete len:624 (-),score=83.41 TRINITY_DN2461_c0_g2_i1:57-1904(-)